MERVCVCVCEHSLHACMHASRLCGVVFQVEHMEACALLRLLFRIQGKAFLSPLLWEEKEGGSSIAFSAAVHYG